MTNRDEAYEDVSTWFRGAPDPKEGVEILKEDKERLATEAMIQESETQMACLTREELETLLKTILARSSEARNALFDAYRKSLREADEPAIEKKARNDPDPVLSIASLNRLMAKYLSPGPSQS